MRIAIYDKWLSTLGGGEKVATVMAEILSKEGYEVDIISNFDIVKNDLEEKMAVDLSRVNLIPWYERSYEKLSIRTKKYDVFINVSFLDHLPSIAKQSIYYVHFPTPIKRNILGFIKYDTVLPFLRKFLVIPEINTGLKPIDEVHTRGGKWLSNNNTLVLSNAPRKFNVTFRIYVEQLTIDALNWVSFESINSKIKIEDKYIDHQVNVLTYKIYVDARGIKDVVIKIRTTQDYSKNALGLVSMTIKNPRYFFWNVIKRYLPRYEMALYGSSDFKMSEGIDSYNIFLANSKFTKKWIKRYWSKNSIIVYPPIDVEKFKSGKKRNIILNVGRFYAAGGPSKRQDVLVSSFKQMFDKQMISRNWELHLVGGVASGWEHEEYLRKLKTQAEGYPISFHIFASFEKLRQLYSEAKVYWHATGFEENEEKRPILFEHFGITVVEAMSAGCVPVVYRGGGLIETVGIKSGLTWKTKKELQKITKRLVDDPKLLNNLSRKFRRESMKYSKQKFGKNILNIVKNICQ